MNSNLNVRDKNLHRSLFSTSDVKQSQIEQKIRHISEDLSVGKNSEIWMEKTVRKFLFTGTTSSKKNFF